MVRMERSVEVTTSLPAYPASQSYRSANMVAEEAAGAEARISTTEMTVVSTEGKKRAQRRKSPSTARGSAK